MEHTLIPSSMRMESQSWKYKSFFEENWSWVCDLERIWGRSDGKNRLQTLLDSAADLKEADACIILHASGGDVRDIIVETQSSGNMLKLVAMLRIFQGFLMTCVFDELIEHVLNCGYVVFVNGGCI